MDSSRNRGKTREGRLSAADILEEAPVYIWAYPTFPGPQAESKQANQSVFRQGLLNQLQREYQPWEQLRAPSLQGWVCYVTFICNIFDYLRVNNMPMMALVNPVYDCLFRMAQPDSLHKEEEVDCLVLQLHRIGEQLEKMNGQRMDELFGLLRDGFLLQDGLSSLSQLLLLQLIEFRAAGWKTTPHGSSPPTLYHHR
ncbi:MIF4G domain-containing protein-like [Notamacropus eugenii]|uniref:MIF4G domain-containing protein-like n=1 Tax=Notamacropus eugenii TaxID=9315 RepID=UPI003B66B423